MKLRYNKLEWHIVKKGSWSTMECGEHIKNKGVDKILTNIKGYIICRKCQPEPTL